MTTCCGRQEDPALRDLHQTWPTLRSGSCPNLAPTSLTPFSSPHHQGRSLNQSVPPAVHDHFFLPRPASIHCPRLRNAD